MDMDIWIYGYAINNENAKARQKINQTPGVVGGCKHKGSLGIGI